MESSLKEGNKPVGEKDLGEVGIQSTAQHEKLGRNMRGPSRKAKYYLVTDSEQVPWGKGEKYPGRGVKKNLKPYAYKQKERP